MNAYENVLKWYNIPVKKGKKLTAFQKARIEMGAPEGNSNACEPSVSEGPNCGGGGSNRSIPPETRAKNLGIKSDTSRMHIETAHDTLDLIEETKSKFPSVKIDELTSQDMPPGWMAASDLKTNSLIWNDKYNSIPPDKYDEALAADKANGFSISENRKGVAAHEMGHMIAKTYDLNNDKEIRVIYDEFIDIWLEEGEEYARKELSEYGTTNMSEFIAECWADHTQNKNPKPISTKIGQIIEKYKGK